MNIYYIDYTLEITEYSIERFCELFNGENCNFNAETGESDEPLIAMPNDEDDYNTIDVKINKVEVEEGKIYLS